MHECQRSGATACWDTLPQMRASTECSTSTAALPVVLSRDHNLGTLAPWPVMAEHGSTQRLHAREVSQPPQGLNATPVLTCFSFRTAQRYCQGEPQGCSKDMLKQSTSSWTTYSWRRDGLFVVTPRYCGLSRTLLGSEMQTLRCVTRYFVFVFCSGGVVFADTGAARTIVC